MPRRLRRKRQLSSESYAAQVQSLAHDGRGVAHLDGKAVLIQGGLPGEDVRFRYTVRHSSYDEGIGDEIIHPSDDRVEPRCPHFGLCGGCSLQHLDPARQIFYKQDWLLENLWGIGKVRPEQVLEPLTGPYWGYRQKARLGVRHVAKKGRVLVGFRERSSSFVADLSRCEILHPKVGVLLKDLGELIQGLSIFRRLPQIEVAAGDDGLALSFRVLDSPSGEDQARLVDFGRRHGLQIYLQPKGPETTHLMWPETAELSYRLPAYDLELKFKPFHFTQVNAEINRQMIDRAIALLDVKGDDRVLDLFCGLGNFTLPLARRAASVIGVEGDSHLLEWAGQNARDNGVGNVRFFAADLSAEMDAQPWMGEHYDKVLLDPPRSGALEMMPQLARLNPRRVVYVSCHPATLARDASELVHRFGYELLSAGVMDMFPHTAHVESIALFGRR